MKIFSVLIFAFFMSSLSAMMTYVPKNFRPQKARVVVVVHGCLQSAEAMAAGTGWNLVADQNNLLILYPQVPARTHPLNCWGWYLPRNQSAKVGQLQYVMSSINRSMKIFKVSKAPIYVVGMSSGGALTAGLLACFPKKFHAGAIHSGAPYGHASSLKEAQELLDNGEGVPFRSTAPCLPADHQGGVMVLHGEDDRVAHPKNAQLLVSQFTQKLKLRKTTQKVNRQGARYTITNHSLWGKVKAQHVQIEGLGHSWNGYGRTLRNSKFVGEKGQDPTQLAFFEYKGPSSTLLVWKFFSSQK